MNNLFLKYLNVNKPSNALTSWFPANDTFTITTANIERFRINSSGNVGIGTTSPGAPLHIECADSTSADNGLFVFAYC